MEILTSMIIVERLQVHLLSQKEIKLVGVPHVFYNQHFNLRMHMSTVKALVPLTILL